MGREKILPEILDWSLLHTFWVITEEQSISRAALRLCLTQSAVSHSLKRLESQLGARLVERRHPRFSLTEQGLMARKTAAKVFQAIMRLDNNLNRETHSIADTLNLLVVSRIVSETFDEYLVRFHQAHPLIKISVETLPSTEILKKIGQNTPSLGLALCRQDARNIRRVLLIPERYSLYCGKHHPLFSQEKITRQELVSQNFVSFFSEQWADALSPLAVFRDSEQFTGEVVASTNILEEVKRLIYAGYGIGCLPDNVVAGDVREGNLRKLPPEGGVADIPIYLVWSRQRKLKAVEKAFIKGLYEAFNIEEGFSAD